MTHDKQPPAIRVSVAVPHEGVEGALYGAFSSGGIGYWGAVIDWNLGAGIGDLDVDTAPLRGGWIRIKDREGDDRIYVFSRSEMRRALELMPSKAPEQFAALFNGQWDKWTGDTLVQLALFGEVKYG